MKIPNWLSGMGTKMIEVHHYKILEPKSGTWMVAPHKCTAERIKQLDGKIIAGTMDIVARSSLDKDGCYDPKTRNNPA